MNEFWMFFRLGRQHILDPQAYDHILFVLALCTVFLVKDWKKVLVMVTAFTIGHSVTLAMVALGAIHIDASVVEILIPITILITGVLNIRSRHMEISVRSLRVNYVLALVFGFIHGMGFSSYLRSLLGEDLSILNQLLSFNLGLEVGQVLIVAAYFTVVFFIEKNKIFKKSEWTLVMSSGIIGISVTLLINLILS